MRITELFSRGKKLRYGVKKHWRFVLYPLGLLPALWLLKQGIDGQLGADPVNVFERGLGLWAFRFLVLCLCVAPLYAKTGLNFLRYRRLLGLLAFFYASFHLVAYMGLDAGFNLSILLKDMTHRPFTILGMTAFTALLPLALTSNRWAMRWLKRGWKRLHLLVFPAALCAMVHFYLSFKTLNDMSAFYGALMLCCITVRVPKWMKGIRKIILYGRAI